MERALKLTLKLRILSHIVIPLGLSLAVPYKTERMHIHMFFLSFLFWYLP